MLLQEASSETGLLKHYLTTFFGVCNVKNTSATRVIFFFKMLKFKSRFQKDAKKMQKKFFVSEIIASEDAVINCLY